MRAVLWTFRLFIFLFLLGFSIKNTESVSVRFFFDAVWQAPLIIVVLAFFAGGVLLGLLALLGSVFSSRREITKLKREVKNLHEASAAASPRPSISKEPDSRRVDYHE